MTLVTAKLFIFDLQIKSDVQGIILIVHLVNLINEQIACKEQLFAVRSNIVACRTKQEHPKTKKNRKKTNSVYQNQQWIIIHFICNINRKYVLIYSTLSCNLNRSCDAEMSLTRYIVTFILDEIH